MHLITELVLPGQWRKAAPTRDRNLEILLDPSVPQTLPGSWLEWAAPIDAGVFTLERARGGAALFRHETGRHLLSPDRATLRCAPADEHNPAWFRVLLDPVLTCAALLGGREGLHAGSVVVGACAVAITAGSGGGKSTLVAELMQRGHALVADDITMLDQTDGVPPHVLPGPPVMTLPDSRSEQYPGEVLLALPGEAWVSAPVIGVPAPLRAIIHLDRRTGATTSIGPCRDALHVLLGGGMLKLPRTRGRAVSRLDLASTLATHCDILTLTAAPHATPTELAVMVEEAMGAT